MTAVSKVTLNGTTLMDATTATASANEIISPYTAMTADGVMTTGTASGGGDELYHLINGTITDAEIDWSKVTNIKNGRFWQSSNLTTVDNPTVTNIGEKSFENCSKLKNVEITFTSQLIIYCSNAFAYCGNLETVKLHFTLTNNADTLFGSGFINGSGKLHTVILEHKNDNYPDRTLNIRYGSFGGANSLRTLVLKGRNVFLHTDTITSGNFSGIYNNPTESTIYVASALISTYQTATNWSTLYDRGVTFAPIEGSIYE